MQFIDPKLGGLANGCVKVVAASQEVGLIQLDRMGSCPNNSFDTFPKPYMLVIHDAQGTNLFQIAIDFEG